jgi:aryl-alcohol dehydrogenase-like predicted oxidoreductase
MRHRQLGSSGLSVSVVGLGCNNFGSRIDAQQAAAVVDAAIDHGITLFDTADIYGKGGGSESLLGAALTGRRDRVVIATKFGGDMGDGEVAARASRRYIRKAVEASLSRLRTDWIDLYQLHFPDGVTPVEETLSALTDLVREGKVRYIGSSNFAAWQVVEADLTARRDQFERFVSAQNQYSLLKREAEAELLPACRRFGIGVLPYFPLASGLLTGKYHRGEPPPEGSRLAARPDALRDANFDTIERLQSFAQERGHALVELAIAGLLARRQVSSVIAGATRPEQVAQNVAAAEWELSRDDVAALARVLSGG